MSLKKENPKLYDLAKQRVLALGFGCGAARFAEMCREAGFSLAPEWKRWWSAMVEPSPGRERLFRMFHELERAGVKITVNRDQTRMRVAKSGLERTRQILVRHLPATLKVIECHRPSGPNPQASFEIVLNKTQARLRDEHEDDKGGVV